MRPPSAKAKAAVRAMLSHIDSDPIQQAGLCASVEAGRLPPGDNNAPRRYARVTDQRQGGLGVPGGQASTQRKACYAYACHRQAHGGTTDMFGTEALDKGLTKIFEALTWMFD